MADLKEGLADKIKSPVLHDMEGNQVALPEDQIQQALQSGKYGFLPGVDVPVTSPEGERLVISSENVSKAIKMGYSYFAPSEQMDYLKERETSGAGGAAEAFLTGAARSATLGGSDWLAQQAGADPDYMKGLEEKRPGWSGAGEIAGFAASMGFAPEALAIKEAQAALKAAKLAGDASKITSAAKALDVARTIHGTEMGLNDIVNPVGAIGKIGGKVTKAIGGAEMAAPGMLGAATKIGATAMGSAVEGALLSGVGNTISEATLGDPDLNAEKIAANFGYGALFGGALGGAFKTAEIGIPAAVGGARDAIKKIHEITLGTGEGKGFGEGGGLIGKVMPENLTEAWANRGKNMDINQQTKMVTDTTTELNTLSKNLQTQVRTLNDEIRPKEVEAHINTADSFKVDDFRQGLVNKIDSSLQTIASDSVLYSQPLGASLKQMREQLTRDLESVKNPADVFNTLKGYKQKLDGILNEGLGKDIPVAKTRPLISEIRNYLNSGLKDENIFGKVGAKYGAHDELLSEWYNFMPPKERGLSPDQKFFKTAFLRRVGKGSNTRWEFDPRKVESVFKNQEKPGAIEKLNKLDEFFNTAKRIPDHIESAYKDLPNERYQGSTLAGDVQSTKSTVEAKAKEYKEGLKNKTGKFGILDYLTADLIHSHPVVGALVTAYNVMTRPMDYINKLATLERFTGKASDKIGSFSKKIFQGSFKAIEAGTKGPSIMMLAHGADEKNSKLLADLKQMKNDPEYIANKVAETSHDLNEFAPNTQSSLNMTLARGAQFLASKAPGPQSQSPFAPEYKLSSTEIADYNRYASIVENPMLAMHQINNGMLVPQTIETLKSVYPKLYSHMQESLLEHAYEALRKGPIAYNKKQALSAFLGQPVDISFAPNTILGNQISYAEAPRPNELKAKSKPMSEMSLADRTRMGRDDDES